MEALIEFKFASESEWDWTIPGMFYTVVKEKFPKRREGRVFAIRVDLDDKGVPSIAPPEAENKKLMFLSNDEKTLVQLAPNLLAVNRLQPYEGWCQFKPQVIEALNTYIDVAQPKGIMQIGVRYINRIVLPGGQVELGEYFRVYPNLPTSRTLKEFFSRNVLDYQEDNATLILILASNVQPSDAAIMLDLDYSIMEAPFSAVDHAASLIEKAHERLEEMFESCVTDKLRELFEED